MDSRLKLRRGVIPHLEINRMLDPGTLLAAYNNVPRWPKAARLRVGQKIRFDGAQVQRDIAGR